MGTRPERRSMPRYRLDTDVAIDASPGRTIDLSGNGMLLETRREFAPGDRIELVFSLVNAVPPAHVTCTARVVRIEPRGRSFAVAVMYEPTAFNAPMA